MLFFLQDEGYLMQVGDETITVHGAALCMLGDTPASNFIGGFKESVAFAFRKCRQVTLMLTKFVSYNIDPF